MEMLPNEEMVRGVLKAVAAVLGVTIQCVVHLFASISREFKLSCSCCKQFVALVSS
jgi:hypothetical protein